MSDENLNPDAPLHIRPARLESVPSTFGTRYIGRRLGEMDGAFQEMAGAVRRTDDTLRHHRRRDLF